MWALITLITLFFLSGVAGLVITGFLIAKKNPIMIFSLFFSTISLVGFLSLYKDYLCIEEMQRRLNAPICSLGQLYGYKVLDKRYFAEKPSFEKLARTDYFVDLEDLLPDGGTILRNIKVSEKIYNDPAIEKGKEFLQ
ncbi:MAG: hypothetical protein Q8N58_02375 [bacterium]|nr:hypothetical protein [bacterium]